jgi:hypothetical protein
MTDRELLELAAKAAGYALCEWPDEPGKLRAEIEPNWRPVWNPLTDDGDALRLAVKLELRVLYHPALRQAIVRPYYAAERENETVVNLEDTNADPYAATRRAIVRAAAEIGRAMK